MAIDLGDMPKGTPPTPPQQAQIRSSIGLGSTGSAAFSTLTLAGQSVTGTVSTNLVDLATTWNTSGSPTAIKLNVNNVASGVGSNLLDLQVGGSSKFKVDKDGVTTLFGVFNTCTLKISQSGETNGFGPYGSNAILAYANGARTMLLGYGGGFTDLRLTAAHRFGWTSDAFSAAAVLDAIIVRDAAGIIAQRNDLNGQTFRVYNSTDATPATNFDRATFGWTSNVLRIGTEIGGTYTTARGIEFVTNSILRMSIAAAGTVHIQGSMSMGGNYDSIAPSGVAGYLSLSGFNGAGLSASGTLIFRSKPTINIAYMPLAFSGETSAFPAIKRNGAGLDIRLADDSALTNLSVSQLSLSDTWNSNLSVTGASGTGSVATITFASQTAVIPVGSTIVVASINPTGYNGTFVVTASSLTSVSYANATTAAWVSGGNIQQLFTAVNVNVTDTASNVNSNLLDLKRNNVSQFKVDKTGNIVFSTASAYGGSIHIGSYGFGVGSNSFIAFSSNAGGAGSSDLFISRKTTANLRLGLTDSAAPVAQTVSVQSVIDGTNNAAGTNLTIAGSQGTGTGAGGSVIFQVAPAGSSGSTQNPLSAALTIDSERNITIGGPWNDFSFKVPAGGGSRSFSIIDGTNRIFHTSTNGLVTVGHLAMGASTPNADVYLQRDAANTLALRNAGVAQTFRIYNTYTDATTFERLNLKWDTNVLKIGTEKGSVGGAARDLVLETDATERLRVLSTGNTLIKDSLELNTLAPLVAVIKPVLTLYRNGSGGDGSSILWKRDGGQEIADIRCHSTASTPSLSVNLRHNYIATGSLATFVQSGAATGYINFGLTNGIINATTNIYNSAFAQNTIGLVLGNMSSGANSNIDIHFHNLTSQVHAAIRGIYAGTAKIGGLSFLTANGSTLVEALRITPTSNVGIGTTAPISNLEVAQSTTGAGLISVDAAGTTVTGVRTQFLNTFKIGDTITSAGQTLTISAIASDTSMTTSAAGAAIVAAGYTLVGGSILNVKGNGRVGIGTTTPLTLFDVNGTTRVGSFFYVDRPSGNGTATIQFTARGSTVASNFGNPIGNGSGEIITSGLSGLIIGNQTSTPLVFGTNNLERVRILATGEVGIGTASPTKLLHIYSETTSGAAQLLVQNDTNTTVPIMQFLRRRASGAAVINQDSLGRISVLAAKSSSVNLQAGYIDFQAFGTPSGFNNVLPSKINFATFIDDTYATYLNSIINGAFVAGGTTGQFIFNKNDNIGGDYAPDIGISRLGIGKIGIGNATAGTSAGTLIAGNIGIGITTPTNPLHVYGITADQGIILDNVSNPRFSILRGGTERLRFNAIGNIGTISAPGGNGLALGGITDTSHLVINSSGNIGIGTIAPSANLQVGPSDSGNLIVTSGSGGSDGSVALRWSSSERVGFTSNAVQYGISGITGGAIRLGGATTFGFIVGDSSNGNILLNPTTSGKIGIGTITPAEKLDVVGNAKVSGHFSAATKSFLIPHPTKADKQLQYACLEGPENGVYIRGKTNESIILLPEYWRELVDEDSVTVTLTQIGKPQQLFVASQNSESVEVGNVDGFYNYVIFGERKDVDKLQTEI